jgi:AraC family transcriptional regulator, positive regulator of tynA and feaB
MGQVHITTKTVHPRDRLAYWREEVVTKLPRHTFNSIVGPAFVGEVRFHPIADLSLLEFDCNPCEVSRTRTDILRCTNDDIMLKFQLSGGSVTAQDGRQAVLKEGSCTLFDTSRPFDLTQITQEKAFYLAIPRQKLLARLGPTTALTTQLFDTRESLGALMAGFLKMLPELSASLEGASALQIAEHALDLIALTISTHADRKIAALSSARALALLRLKSAIDSGLCDPEFGPTTASAAVGISVRYANELLSQEGTSTQRYIVQRRLERCRDALDDPAQATRTIGDIAFSCGFSDLSHFGRRFKDKFGLSPKDYRHRSAAKYAE